ncbi:hypothetical protein BT96DRAFT_1002521 [Gymnopus androsaceus JB14]|uniref:Uncharacterized protein n=1 Tax=Gymnopus androsaceus JB14 TaxID=1447944 RepID=A0A6A4GWF3_9AGAR|nr:hypothetical protein BT96DRAFT_1002521 [Gymnopus androsaceus JB14]
MLAEDEEEDEDPEGESTDRGDKVEVDAPLVAGTQGTCWKRNVAHRCDNNKGKEWEIKANGWIWTK